MTTRDRLILLVVVAIAAMAAFWMLALKPKNDEIKSLDAEVTQAQQQRDSARSELSLGQQSVKAFAGNYTAVMRLGKAVPADDQVDSLLYQLEKSARKTRVDFISLNAGGASKPAAPAAPATPPSSSSSSPPPAATTNGSSANAAPSTGSTPNGSTPSTTPGSASTETKSPSSAPQPATVDSETSSSTYTFTFTGNYFRLSDFFGSIQDYVDTRNKQLRISGRLLTVESIDLKPDSENFPVMKAEVSATAYLLPADQPLLGGATVAGPQGASSTPPAPSATPSPSSSSAPAGAPATAKGPIG